MAVNYRETTINGLETHLWGQGHDLEARRLAAALPRGDETVRYVDAETDPCVASVWFDPPEDDHGNPDFLRCLEGLTLREITHFPNGTIAVTVEVDR